MTRSTAIQPADEEQRSDENGDRHVGLHEVRPRRHWRRGRYWSTLAVLADFSKDLGCASIDIGWLVEGKGGKPLVEGHRGLLVLDEDDDRVVRQLVSASCHPLRLRQRTFIRAEDGSKGDAFALEKARRQVETFASKAEYRATGVYVTQTTQGVSVNDLERLRSALESAPEVEPFSPSQHGRLGLVTAARSRTCQAGASTTSPTAPAATFIRRS